MDQLCFEDFPVGSTRRYGDYEVTRDAITAFAKEFDPQPFHLDEAAASASLLGGLSASGWHIFAIAMRLHCDEWALRSTSLGSPGVAEGRWLRPVRPGDRLSIALRVEKARLSASRPSRGLIEMVSLIKTQSGDVAASTRHTHIFARRGCRDEESEAPPASRDRPAGERGAAPASEPGVVPASFDSVALGHPISLGAYTFDAERMIRFAKAFDPQPFHIENAANGPFGGLTASGWHTAAAFMRKLVDAKQRGELLERRAGRAVRVAGPGLGVSDLRWKTPVRAGDRLSFSTTPLAKRSTSRAGWSLVTSHNVGVNQRDETAIEFTSAALWPME